MPAIRVVSAALLGLGALAVSASAVVPSGDDDHDVTPFGFGLLPHSVAAGEQVTLQIDRGDDGCEGDATVTSGIFDTVRIASDQESATTTIDRDVRAGAAYQVTFTCDGASGSTQLNVTDGGPEDATPSPTQQAPGAVEAGEGGTLGGFDIKEIGLGTALVAGSIGAAYHLSRRRGEEDGT
ncbi:hypothetical protein ACFV0T_04340 [Streptomyces sp. NPDC059582]|uniref:hypothetical protein n=1 Tax=Streptomyces sp. NPDC059582 TaxID=3346875 RepID=UPI00368BD32F